MKTVLAAGLSLALAVGPVVATAQDLPDVNPAMVQLVAEGCVPGEMFTIDSTRPFEGGRRRQLGAAAAPFQTLEVTATSRSNTVISVDLWAYQADDTGDFEARKAYASGLFDVFDAGVFEAGLFTDRVWDEDREAVVYSRPVSDPQSALVMELSQLGVSFIVSCGDRSREGLAMDEFMGRTRVERPVRPVLPTPQRIALTECDDPVRAEAIYDDFETGGGSDVLNLATASSAYFEHLAQWYGQELIDKGVWTQQKRDTFRMAFMNDRIIARELEQQLARLQPLLGLTMEVAERREASDAVGSCKAIVRLFDLIGEMGQYNETQWDRATSLYRAEATRLGVTLD